MHPILDQFNLQPVLIDARQSASMLMPLPKSEQKQHLGPQEMALLTGLSQDSQYKPYQLMDGGIAVIPVRGTLMHNLGYSTSYATGYDVIRRKLAFARDDTDVKGVYMPFHTPGGSVFGCPDTGDLIHAIAQVKPLWTMSDDMSYSAGEWLHSQGSRRLVTQSGGMGSIGVLIGHVDVSGALDEMGIKVTLIHAGAHKVDGNPYEALSKETQAELEASCEKTRQTFATVVARGTGLSTDAILATQAQCYTGSDAVDIGLADAVVSSNDVLAEFAEYLEQSSHTINLSGQSMSKETKPEVNLSAAAIPTETEHATPVAEPQPTAEQAAQAERQRIGDIMKSDAAKANPGLASHLAYQTSLSATEAQAILAASAPEQPTPQPSKAGSDAFLQAMATEQHPEIASDEDEVPEADAQTPNAQANAMARDFAAATGFQLKQ
ncbi:S49 family peptidase [Celerinatantimonas sp. MCCC 1A17872]|uniref:S49 family peptidase n=1 Tax=Celerinatantimonas sp. MCCC 1A17872 TaxID=3177514 RepID=UPI0038C50483